MFSMPIQLELGSSLADVARHFASDPFLLILDSAGRHRERDSRYSFLTSDPTAVCRIDCADRSTDPF